MFSSGGMTRRAWDVPGEVPLEGLHHRRWTMRQAGAGCLAGALATRPANAPDWRGGEWTGYVRTAPVGTAI